MKRDQIREIFLRNGFKVQEGQTDLKEYVFRAAEELMTTAAAVQDGDFCKILRLENGVQCLYMVEDVGGTAHFNCMFSRPGYRPFSLKLEITKAPLTEAFRNSLIESFNKKEAMLLFNLVKHQYNKPDQHERIQTD